MDNRGRLSYVFHTRFMDVGNENLRSGFFYFHIKRNNYCIYSGERHSPLQKIAICKNA